MEPFLLFCPFFIMAVSLKAPFYTLYKCLYFTHLNEAHALPTSILVEATLHNNCFLYSILCKVIAASSQPEENKVEPASRTSFHRKDLWKNLQIIIVF